jgi:hypothetical protein
VPRVQVRGLDQTLSVVVSDGGAMPCTGDHQHEDLLEEWCRPRRPVAKDVSVATGWQEAY